MNFTLTINAQITAQGGLDVPTGSIYSGQSNGFKTINDVDHVKFTGAFFKSEADKDAGKSALKLEKIHENPLSEKGMIARRNNAEYSFSGKVSADDFTYDAEIVNKKAQLTSASALTWIEQVKQQIADKLEISIDDISLAS